MPYASKAQARKFHAMLKKHEIDEATVREYDKSTDFDDLPERVRGKKVRDARKKKGK